MILCDTGPLVGMIDADDPSHGACLEALRRLPDDVLVTTWPCITEAMYLVGRAGGYKAQETLWGYLVDGDVVVHSPPASEWAHMRALMGRYSDAPMDFADASLVAAAETLAVATVFTLDRHFRAYLLEDGRAFDIVP